MDLRRLDPPVVRARATAGLPGMRAGVWLDVPDTEQLRDWIAAGLVTVDGAPAVLPSARCCL